MVWKKEFKNVSEARQLYFEIVFCFFSAILILVMARAYFAVVIASIFILFGLVKLAVIILEVLDEKSKKASGRAGKHQNR